MNKRILTCWNQFLLTAVLEDDRVVQLDFEPENSHSVLNRIYVGKVKNVVKNIQAAFIDIGNDTICYYSIEENHHPIFLNQKSGGKLIPGDEILVQVVKDSVKTKAPTVSCNLNFSGRYTILTYGKPGIGISSKFHGESRKNQLKERLTPLLPEMMGVIIRTNAAYATDEEIEKELQASLKLADKIINDAAYRTCFSCVYTPPAPWLTGIRDKYDVMDEEIITDNKLIFGEITNYFRESEPKLCERVRLYEDSYSLMKLYSLEKVIDQALSERVWLKSGGYLVIQPAEALTVIDVNTGKYDGKKNLQDTFFRINLEAAKEIALQIRLRNLSGIIIVDFIDMANKENQDKLMSQLGRYLNLDPIKTVLVDITSLNLVEITRKKIKKPLHEQLGTICASCGGTGRKFFLDKKYIK